MTDDLNMTSAHSLPARSWTGGSRAWLERLWASIADRGRTFVALPALNLDPLARAKALAHALLSERGEASGAAVSRALLDAIAKLQPVQRGEFLNFLAREFQADPLQLTQAAADYLAQPSPDRAARLAHAAEPPRQELLRRMNMAEGGTRALVAMRKDIPALLGQYPALTALDSDMRHLFASWFNRGFLELRQIDWQTPAAILEKLIAYEAVHEILGWDDLRRRLAADRRCFAFFHPALRDEPLIFVEVALVQGLADSVAALLERDTDDDTLRQRAAAADTAIFYSISNCQDGLRGISFGNFLIKQVVEVLRHELPGIRHFATLSPVPGLRKWLESGLAEATLPPALLDSADSAKVQAALARLDADKDRGESAALREFLIRACACFLTQAPAKGRATDPVARFHLGNGARLERINWMANSAARGLRESWGLMVNYLYDPAKIEAYHEAFVGSGKVARSPLVDGLMAKARKSKSGTAK